MGEAREIDRQIAELMGWNVYVSDTYGDLRYDGNKSWHGPVPEFSSDWNAMRLLVEWLNSKNILIHITQYTDKQAAVTLEVNDLELTEYEEDESAPLALCKAVLALHKEVLFQ